MKTEMIDGPFIGDDGKYHYLYKIINNVNNNYYYGVHSCNSLEKDSYSGSGKILKKAIKKYGSDNFTKLIIKFFKTEDEKYKSEKEIITDASNNRQEKLVGKAEYVPFELATVETEYGTQSDVFSSYKGVQLNDIDRMSGANLGENVSIDNMTGIDAYREVRNNSVEATLLKLERLSNKKNFDEAKNEDGRPFCGK